jgi:hypothetical protein
MRVSVLSWLLAAGPAIASASAAAGQVFLFDVEAAPQQTAETIDPATARLILAQRLDLSQFHSIADADDEAIRLVNDFGGQTQQLFGSGSHVESRSRVMIVVEGIQDPLGMHTLCGSSMEIDRCSNALDCLVPVLTEFTSFSVSPAPHSSDSLQLFSTLSSEAGQLPHTDGPDSSVLRALSPLSDIKGNALNSYNNRRTLLYVKSIAVGTPVKLARIQIARLFKECGDG